MSFKDITNLQIEYQSKRQDVLSEFYIPCLNQAKIYKRAVGFFSSSILMYISEGLFSLASKNGHMKLLISPMLDEQDYDAIKHGYEIRKYIEEKMIEGFHEEADYPYKEQRYRLLAYMIANNLLDIKVGVVDNQENDRNIFHDKLGVMQDDEDNMICFSGSANETYNGYIGNYENIDVFYDWKSTDSAERCKAKNDRFDRMWNNQEIGLIIIDFPEVIKKQILQHHVPGKSLLELSCEYFRQTQELATNIPTLRNISLYDYQLSAIDQWEENQFRGIFDMATGTGKTYTACGAITRIFEVKKRVFTVIVCPYIFLVDQWAEEVKNFNIEPLICYGGIDYKQKLNRISYQFRHKEIDFACIIITNASFMDSEIQKTIHKNLDKTLIVVDEAHNFGASNISKHLADNYAYRLALSATIERYGDLSGTEKLYKFFGQKCINYDLERAIREGKLSHYKYYPIVVSLDEDEFDDYAELSERIMSYRYNHNDEMPEGLKRLLIQRARVVSSAKSKIYKLIEMLEQFKNGKDILIYCGDVKYRNGEFGNNQEEIRQIDVVCNKVKHELKMNVAKYTSEEDQEFRKRLLSRYKNGDIQALAAIRCLDEGMNIPSINRAFILASSINPKQYIQRRGRVLRKSKGKQCAEIYDFITLPMPIEYAQDMDLSYKAIGINLVKKELLRIQDFAKLADNSAHSNVICDQIKEAYEIGYIEEDSIYG